MVGWISVYTVISLIVPILCDDKPRVTIGQGDVIGIVKQTASNREYNAFLGIPYAEPPVGELRFQNPVPAKNIVDEFDATSPASLCWQFMWMDNALLEGSEDCLYLNIYTPRVSAINQGKSELLDVLVILHGGGSQAGDSSVYGADYILDETDVIVVTLNYRLGVFGFMSLEDEELRGNLGLKDQQLALKWVNKTIAAFGGDSNKVTLIGFSSGSAHVHAHVNAISSQGLFHRAICASGSLLSPQHLQKEGRKNALVVAKALNCSTEDSKSILSCMRRVPASQIAGLGTIFPHWTKFPVFNYANFQPIIINADSDEIMSVVDIDKLNPVPVLISHTSDECFLTTEIFLNETNGYMKDLESNWNDVLPFMLRYKVTNGSNVIAEAIRQCYMGNKSIKDIPSNFTRMNNDRLVNIGTELFGANQALMSSSTNNYLLIYSWVDPSDTTNYAYKDFGAGHGDDMRLIFHFTGDNERTENEKVMSKILIGLWMKFIKEDPVQGWKPIRNDITSIHGTIDYLEVADIDTSKNVFKRKKLPEAIEFYQRNKLLN